MELISIFDLMPRENGTISSDWDLEEQQTEDEQEEVLKMQETRFDNIGLN